MFCFAMFADEPEFVAIAAGSVLFREGEPGNQMYVLVSGSAELIAPDGQVEILRAGDIVGEGALASSSPRRTASVIARTDCELIAIDLNRFHQLVRQAPDFATRVLDTLASRLLRGRSPARASQGIAGHC